MRKVIIGEKTIEVRPLTRGEIKKLKPLGYSCLACHPNFDDPDAVVEEALKAMLDQETIEYLDDFPAADTRKVWKELLAETYGNKEEEKNSSSTGGGTTTASA